MAIFSSSSAGKILSGHFGGYSPDTFPEAAKEMDEIRKQSGQTPAILSCDWGTGWHTNEHNLRDAHQLRPAMKR